MGAGICLAKTTLVFCLLLYLVESFKISPFQGAPTATGANLKDEGSLSFLLYTRPTGQEEIFSEAVQLLDSMKSSPSCSKLAVTNLITSCQQLSSDGSDAAGSNQGNLDRLKSLYAARLAVCELTGAGARIPGECFSMTDLHTARPIKTSVHGYRPTTDNSMVIKDSQLDSCLQALESKPQWWTSYSNNRQNAAIMCQAARIEVERDELLDHHRHLADVTFGLTQSLNQSLKHAASEISRQKKFLEMVEEMRCTLVDDLQKNESTVRELFGRLVADAEAIFRVAVSNIQTHLVTTGSNSADIQSSIESIRDLKRNLDQIHSDALSGRSELMAAEKEHSRVTLDMALAVQESLAEIRQDGIKAMAEEFGNLQMSLRDLHELFIFVIQNYESFDERLKQFDEAFQHLERRASVLDTVFQWHIMNQTRLQQSIAADMRIAQALLKEITVSAANLQTVIGEAHRIMSNIGTLTHMIGSMPWWCWFLAGFCLMALVSPRVIVIVLVSCGKYLLASVYGSCLK
ncbi:hypothetical protein VTO42DRAFT_8157 [Malbranchea cinnamomea]